MAVQNHIWLIRHGETPWSLSGQHTGKTEMELTATGKLMAKTIGRELAGRRFDLILTSPRMRARDTCRLSGYGEAAAIDDNLQEWDYGAYEGRTSADIMKEAPNWSLWRDGVPGGETIEAVSARADRVIRRALDCTGDVALFAHGHILRVLAARWVGLPPDGGRYFSLDAGSISILGSEYKVRVISRWNFVPKLES
jgi:broad specificity phosphatase PhoE